MEEVLKKIDNYFEETSKIYNQTESEEVRDEFFGRMAAYATCGELIRKYLSKQKDGKNKT